jgi:hypothetical protein
MDSTVRKRAFAPKKKFTNAEDSQILELIDRFGGADWDAIARVVQGRTARQCRERWRHYLKPMIKNTPWTAEEDQILIREFANLGAKWSALALFLPGRTDVNVKNRWIRLTKAEARQGSIGGESPPQVEIPPSSPPRTFRFPSIEQFCAGSYRL